MEFKSSLKKFRVDNKLTQDELGKKVGLSGKVISKWESGYSMPDIDNIKKLCEIFDCEYADLIGPEKKKRRKKKAESKEENIPLEDNNRLNIYNPGLRSLKKISKVLYVFTKIYRVLIFIVIALIVTGMFFVPSMVSSVRVNTNTISFYDFKGDKVSITGEDILLKGDYILKYKDKVINKNINFDIIKEVADIFDNVPREEIIVQIEVFLVMIVISLIVSNLAFYNLEKFFKNILDNDLVFISDNVGRLSMATCLFVGVLFCDLGISFLLNSFMSIDLYSNIGMSRIIRLFFMVLMVYVFKYGYELNKKKEKDYLLNNFSNK